MADRFIAVDWSAANRPVSGADSVWIAVDDGRPDVTLSNPPTRLEAMSIVRDAVRDAVDAGDRVIVGVDAGFGYPVGTAAALGLAPPAWSATWRLIGDLIEDDEANRSNRFAVAAELNRRLGSAPGPFWGGPAAATDSDLGAKRPPFPDAARGGELVEYRLVEELLRGGGHRPQSVWKLYTTGSVGSQTLLAIAHLERLRSDAELADHVRIWPFETREADDLVGPVALVVELWPNLAAAELDPTMVKDAAQVGAAAAWLRSLAETDQLESLLLLTDVDAERREIARAEEGWIFGAERAGAVSRNRR